MGKQDNRRFKQGSGTYRCDNCDILTRETGSGESGLGLCKHCYTLMEWENFIQDGGGLENVPLEVLKELGLAEDAE